jgi:prepilin-type N-terminal cleavage/methylation domain-containing protein
MFISRLSAFVDIQKGASSFTAAYLVSELTKIDEPRTRRMPDVAMRRAFTLIEVLVVIAIIGTSVALLRASG